MKYSTRKSYGTIDNITATYCGNQIASLRDDAPTVLLESSLDLPHGAWSGADFAYDRNGNQTRDLSRGVADIDYNALNLPARIEMASGGTIEYLYSAAGTKLAEIVRDEDDQIINRRDYAGMFEYEADSIVRMALASGYVTVADTVYHLYAPDYQGNIVAVYNTATGQQEHYKDYYPYGLPHAEMPQSSSILPGLNPGLGSGLGPIIITPTDPETETPSTNRRWYSAKELTTDHGLNTYDFEARSLAPAFPRFTTPDPLATDYTSFSIYNFCAGEPINFIDPTGMDIYTVDCQGCLVSTYKTDEYDMVVVVDNEGQPIDGAFYKVPYGTLRYSYNLPSTIKDNSNYSYFDCTDFNRAGDLFRFLARYTSVEWILADPTNVSGLTSYIVITSHDEWSNDALNSYISKKFRAGSANKIVMFSHIYHNHPVGAPFPSQSDIEFANKKSTYYGSNITFKIYSAVLDVSVPINEFSIIASFFTQNTKAKDLPSCVTRLLKFLYSEL